MTKEPRFKLEPITPDMSTAFILAADPGVANFGWAWLAFKENKKPKFIDGGLIETDPNAEMIDRLRHIQEMLFFRMAYLHRENTICASEDVSGWKRSAQSIRDVFAAQQRFDAVAHHRQLRHVQLHPLTWRKMLGLGRGASKRDVEVAVVHRVESVPYTVQKMPFTKRNHIMDAAAIALAASGGSAFALWRKIK